MERPKRILEDLQVAKLLFSYLLSLNSRSRSSCVFNHPVTLRKTFFILKLTKRNEKTF